MADAIQPHLDGWEQDKANLKAAGHEPGDVKRFKFRKNGGIVAVLKDGTHVVIREGAQ